MSVSEQTLIEDGMEEEFNELKKHLIGRSIIATEIVSYIDTQTYYDTKRAYGILTLDNGEKLKIIPNESSCICGNGDFLVTGIGEVPNVITNVELNKKQDAETDDYDTVWSIYVWTENQKINAVDVSGNEGEGYYGTGFSLEILPPKLKENSHD